MTTERSVEPLVNSEQKAAWNGEEGSTWAAHAEREPDRSTGLHAELLAAAAVGPTDQVLDVGCGTGQATRQAARLAHRGHALGVDLSSPMLRLARSLSKREGIDNISFLQADAQVHPFPPGAHDLALSHFGTMFFDDAAAAFANLAATLRPGGKLVFVCPRAMHEVEWFTVPYAAVAGHPPMGQGTDLSRMFSLADGGVVAELLAATGFERVDLVPVDTTIRFGADVASAAEFFADAGPLRALVEQSPGLGRDAALELLVPALEPYAGPDGVRIPGRHWLVTATRRRTALRGR